MSRKRRFVLAGGILLGVAGIGILLRPRAKVDSHLDAVTKVAELLTGEDGDKLSPGERREIWNRLRRELARLTPRQQQDFWAPRRQALREWLSAFMKTPRPQQVAILNEEIARIEEFRRQLRGGSQDMSATTAQQPARLEQTRQQALSAASPAERALVADFLAMLAVQRVQTGLAAAVSPWTPAGET
jgi:hypothetical protein